MVNADKKLTDNGNNLQLLPLIMDNVPQAVFWKDQNLVYLGCNRAFAEDSGFSSPEEVIGKTDFDMPWKDQAELYRADDRHVMDSGEPKLNYEEPQTTPTGSTTWLRTSKIPVCENGRVVAILGMYEDITEHKQAELDLLLRDRALASSINAVIILSLQTNKPIYANEALFRMTGYNFEEVQQLSLADITGSVAELPKIREAVDKQGFFVGEEIIKRKDGSSFPATFFSSLIRDAKGQAIAVQSSFFDVSEHKQAEALQQQSERLFRALFEMSPDAVMLIDPFDPGNEWPIVDCNAAACLINGYQREELIGQPINIVNAPTDTPIDRGDYLKQLQEGQSVKYEILHRRKNGEAFPVEVSTTMIKVGDRKLLLGIDRDITERKRTEIDLLLRDRALASSVSAVMIVGLDFKPIYANEAFLKMTGYTYEEAMQLAIPDITGYREGIKKIDEAMETQGFFIGEEPVKRKDGSIFPTSFSTSFITTAEGKPIAVQANFIDITERTQAEASIHDNEEKLRAIYEGTNDAIMLLNEQGFFDCNSQTLKMFGYKTKEEFTAIRPSDASPASQPDGRDSVSASQEHIQTAYRQGYERFEWIHRRSNGEDFPAEVLLSAFDLGGQRVLQATVRDITERKQAEMDLLLRDRALASSLNAILIAGLDFKPIYVNESFLKMIGYTYEEAMRLTITDISGDPEGLKRIDNATHTQGFFVGEEPIKRKDGSIFPANFSTSFITNAEGEPIAIQTSFLDITERKQTEQALRDSEAKYSAVVTEARDGVAIIQGNLIQFVNQAMGNMVGYPPSEMENTPIIDYIASEYKDLLVSRMKARLAGEEVSPTYEAQLQHKDGTTVDVEISANVIHYQGKPADVVMIRDITERKQADAQLQQEKSFSDAIINGLPGTFYLFDTQGKMIRWNRQYEIVSGYTSDEIQTMGIASSIAEDDRERVAATIQRAFMEGQASVEANILNRDGRQTPYYLTGQRLQISDQVYLAGTGIDITERKQTEAQLQQEKSFSDAIINGLPGIFFLFDTQGNMVRWNKQYEQVLGYTTEETAARNAIDPIAEEDRARTAAAIQHTFLEGQANVEASLVTKDGKRLPYYFVGQRIQLGNDLYLAGTGIDITERRQAERALRESQQFLQTIMDNIPQSIFWKDNNLIYLGCNSAFANDAGIASPSEIFGKTDWDMPWKDRADAYRADDSLVIKNGIPKLNYEEPQTTPEGRTNWLRTSKIPLYDIEGNAFAVLGMYEDITERKQVEESLSESEERFRRFTEATVEGLIFHERGTIIDVNPAAVAMIGASDTKVLVGRSLLEFIAPEFHQLVLDKMQEQAVLPYEIQCIRTDGFTFPAETSTRAYRLGNREIRASSMRDITERKQAEDAVRSSQEQLLNIIDFLPDATLVTDKERKVIAWNRAVEEMTGIKKEEILGKGDYAYSVPFYGEARPMLVDFALEHSQVADRYEGVQQQGDKLSAEVYVDSVYQGRGAYLLATASPLYDADGDIIGAIESIRDVTERKQLEKQIQEAFERRGLQVQLSTQVSQSIAAASSLTDLYERVVTQVKEQFGYYHTQLLRHDPVQEAVVLVTGYGETGAKMLAAGHRMPMGEGLIGTAAATGEAVLRPDLANDPDWHPNPLLPDTKGEIAVPIKLGATILGVLDVQSNVAESLDADDQLLLEGLCGQIATAIESTRLRQQMSERLEEINRLYRAMSHEGWQTYREQVDLSKGFVYDQAGIRQVEETGLAQELFANIPLTVPGGEVIGNLAVADDPRRPLTSEDETFLLQVSEQVALALESARLFEQTQTALVSVQESQTALNEAMAVAGMANWKLSFETFKFAFNDRLYQMLGTTAQAEGGYELSAEEYTKKYIHPDDAGLITQAIQTGLQSPDPQNFKGSLEYRMLRKDGQMRYMLTDYRLVVNDQGQPIAGVGSFLDITERKLAELAVARRAAELSTVAEVSTTTAATLEPDRLLQSVVDLAKEEFGLYHAHIYTYDESWNTLLLSAGAGEVGRKLVAEEHAIPMSLEQSLVARAARERKVVIVNDVNNEPGFLPNPLLPETCAEMAVPMMVGEKLLGIFDVQSNNPVGFTAEDASIYVTLASQVGVALQNARMYVEQAALVTQLRELDRLKSSFLANMSHELRTPLNSILGFADVIIEELDGPLTENMSNDLRLIQKNGQHLLHLINDVLDMAKIEAGRMNLNPESFTAFEVIEEVTSITSSLASEKNLALFIEEDTDQNVKIYADRTRLRQVMINLVNNAIKFTENGKISLKLVPLDGGRILYTIKDTGIGIPPDKLEAVFQEFTQVDSSTTRKAGGTGLGLPISRKLVEMHGGRLWAESTGISGEGSTFFVELPVEARITETIEKQAK